MKHSHRAVAVYIYKPDSDTFDSLSLANVEDRASLRAFKDESPGSLSAAWKALPVRIYKGKHRSDFPSLVPHIPVFSRRAVEALAPLIAQDTEALPLSSPAGEYFAIHNLQLADCLDLPRSRAPVDPDGRIMFIESYVFDEECLRGKHLFKLRQAPWYGVYFSQELRERIEAAGLQGLLFPQVA